MPLRRGEMELWALQCMPLFNITMSNTEPFVSNTEPFVSNTEPLVPPALFYTKRAAK